MDKSVASMLLDTFIGQLRPLPYEELTRLLRNPQCKEMAGSDGKPYQIEWEAHWDDLRGTGNLRVIVSIDDGTFRASLRPMTASFIMAPDGTFVGE